MRTNNVKLETSILIAVFISVYFIRFNHLFNLVFDKQSKKNQ